jgi:hypothetical protein
MSNRRLTSAQWIEIVQRYEAGEGSASIAQAYSADPMSVRDGLRKRGIEIRTLSEAMLQTHRYGHKETFTCDNCAQEFEAYASQRPRPLKFCKRACGLEYQRTRML